MEKPVKPTDTERAMTERYEHMRGMRQTLRQRTQEMELMIESGMYGWMKALMQYGSDGAPVHRLESRCDTYSLTTPLPVGDFAHDEAIGIFSTMVWEIVKEEAHGYDN
jgi:hypothetical protein